MTDHLLISLSLKSDPKSFVLSLALFPHLPPPLNSQLFLSKGVGFGLRRLPEIPLFCLSAKGLAGYLSELRQGTCPEDSQSSFCCPFSPAELLAAVSNLSSSSVTGPDKVSYPMLRHLLSGMDFSKTFSIFWSLHSFSSIWKISSILPIYERESPDSPASFRPISLKVF